MSAGRGRGVTHDVQGLGPGRDPGELLAEHRHGPRPEGRRGAADVRRDEDARRRPQGMPGRERLGVGDIEGEPEPSGMPQDRPGVRDGPAGDVDDQAPVGHGAQEGLPHQAAGGLRQRDAQDDDVVTREQVGELVDPVHLGDEVVTGAGPARHPRQGDLEGGEPACDGPPDRAVPHDEDPAVGERGAQRQAGPLTAGGVPHGVRYAAQRGEDEGDGQLRGGGVVHPSRVGHPHALGDHREGPVVAGGEELDEAQGRHTPHGGQLGRRPQVRGDDDLDGPFGGWVQRVPDEGLDALDGPHGVEPGLVREGHDRHGSSPYAAPLGPGHGGPRRRSVGCPQAVDVSGPPHPQEGAP